MLMILVFTLNDRKQQRILFVMFVSCKHATKINNCIYNLCLPFVILPYILLFIPNVKQKHVNSHYVVYTLTILECYFKL